MLQDVCLEHSAGLLSLLRAGGAAGGTLETLNFERCHLSAACFARPTGDEGEAQEDALASLSFLKVSECYGEGWDTEGVEAELLELLGQAEELEGLVVQDCALAANALPELLEGEALASLELEECGLDHFPPFEGMEGEGGRKGGRGRMLKLASWHLSGAACVCIDCMVALPHAIDVCDGWHAPAGPCIDRSPMTLPSALLCVLRRAGSAVPGWQPPAVAACQPGGCNVSDGAGPQQQPAAGPQEG